MNELEIREYLENHLGETLSKLNDIRMGLSDIATPHNYYEVRNDDWEMEVIDNYVDLALETELNKEVSPEDYLEGEIIQIVTTDYLSIMGDNYNPKISEIQCFVSDGELDKALELIGDLMDKITSIRVKKSTRDALASFGGKDDSFDTIIQKLLKELKEE